MDTTREGLTGLTKLQPGLPSTGALVFQETKALLTLLSPRAEMGQWSASRPGTAPLGGGFLCPGPTCSSITPLSHSGSSDIQRASRRSCWIQGQASLSPRAQRLCFKSSISNNRLGVLGMLLGVGACEASSIGNLLSGQVRVSVGQTLTWKFSIVAAFSFCRFLQNGMFIWTLA